MTSIQSFTVEALDPTATTAFHRAAFDLSDQVHARASDAPTTGFRGFTVSLVVSQPSTVDSLIGTALGAGATTLTPAKKSLWGYGAVVQAPDGTIWKVATSSKKDNGEATRRIDDLVLLLGVEDVKASKCFYVDHGLEVARGFGSKYVEFKAPPASVKLALYGRRALAKDAGVAADGRGSHRLVINGGAEPFTDADGFEWAPTAAQSEPTSVRRQGDRPLATGG